MKRKFRLKNGSSFEFKVFPLNHRLKDSPPPIPAALGDPREAWRLYDAEIKAFGNAVGPEFVPVPFTFPLIGKHRYGDFIGSAGQRELRHTRIELTEDPLELARPMQKLRRFADLAQILRFPKSEECACVRNLKLVNDVPTFVIGPGPYEEVFATMNSQGLQFSLTSQQLVAAELFWTAKGKAELSKLLKELQRRYGSVTIRQAVHKFCHGLPNFGDSVASYVLGSAALIVTDDGYAVFGRRAKHRVSLNTGLSLATSGGFRFDREKLQELGFRRFAESEILREAYEEVALKGSDCDVTVLALVRELSRAGSPEILALIEFYGTLKDLAHRMETNHHPEQDIDAIFALPLDQALELAREPDAEKVLLPKALATLIATARHFKSGRV